jgi:hypothetical protein
MRTAPLWSSPVFVGAVMIGLWLYRERSHTEAFALWTITTAGSIAPGLSALSALARLDERRLQMERLLSELQ